MYMHMYIHVTYIHITHLYISHRIYMYIHMYIHVTYIHVTHLYISHRTFIWIAFAKAAEGHRKLRQADASAARGSARAAGGANGCVPCIRLDD